VTPLPLAAAIEDGAGMSMHTRRRTTAEAIIQLGESDGGLVPPEHTVAIARAVARECRIPARVRDALTDRLLATIEPRPFVNKK
jgi:hypothetical protein